ncbi:hypothetical protein H4R19_000502 [Coemansia spiralis]|nr:hypothetical protein H4R19_000502 [Coemansia spiralis]
MQQSIAIPTEKALAGAPPPQSAVRPAPRRRRRPPYSYTALIAQAILLSEHQQLTLREIYDSINAMYPQICQGPDVGWQNTIRHNLSLNQCFKRIPRQLLPPSLSSKLRGKGSYWTVDVSLMDENTRKRLEEAVSATPAAALVRASPQTRIAPSSRPGRRARTSPGESPHNSPASTVPGGPFGHSGSEYAAPAAAVAGSVRCVSPAGQSSTLYFQSAMHSPIANIANHAPKHFAPPEFHRHPAARHPYPLSMLPRTPQPYGYHRPAHVGLPFGDVQHHVSAMPAPVPPYLYGAAVSYSRSTARVAGRVPSGESDSVSRGPASLASSSTLGSRQPSPYLPSPSSPSAMAQGAPYDCRDSAKLKINHILN